MASSTPKRKATNLDRDETKRVCSTEEIKDAGTPSTIKIDPLGDVILVPEGGTRLLVSSKLLSVISKPFAAMFSSRFQEGQHLSTANPPLVEFPVGNTEALEWICKLLHGQLKTSEIHPGHHEVGEDYNVDAKFLINVALLIDKYDVCQPAFASAKTVWNNIASAVEAHSSQHRTFRQNSKITKGWFHLLIASYALNDKDGYRSASRHLTLYLPLRSTASSRFLALAQLDIKDVLPAIAYAFLEEKSATIEQDFSRRILKLANTNEGGRVDYDFFLACQLRWPCNNVSHRNLFEEPRLENFALGYLARDLKSFVNDIIRWSYARSTEHAESNFLECARVMRMLEEFEASTRGLRIDCVRAGRALAGDCTSGDCNIGSSYMARTGDWDDDEDDDAPCPSDEDSEYGI